MSFEVSLNRKIAVPKGKQFLVGRQRGEFQHLAGFPDSETLLDEAVPGVWPNEIEVLEAPDKGL